MKMLTLPAALAAFAACHLTVAQADADFGPRTERVYFGDLNITTRSGVAEIYGRLDGAAHRVCDPDLGRSFFVLVPPARCIDKALGDAIAAVNEPALTAYAATRAASPL